MGIKELTQCPSCESTNIYDQWGSGRKLQRGCRECSWKESPRVPEIQQIRNTKLIMANDFSGFCFEIYDQYGHIVTCSRSFNTRAEARDKLIEELDKQNKNPDYAPCTGILWPDKVEVVGERIENLN